MNKYILAIDAGTTSVCAILDNAQVKCWGQNDVGQLGLGNTLDRGDGFNEMGDNLLPVSIGGSADRIEVGEKFACIILTSDGIKCWGTASNGRLGYGDLAFKGDDSLDMPTDDVELKLDDTLVYATLPVVTTLTGYQITPYVAILGTCPSIGELSNEVEDIFKIPLFDLLSTKQRNTSGKTGESMYLYWHSTNCIWGASAKILGDIEYLRNSYE